MAVTLKKTEEIPASGYPVVSGLSDAALAIDPMMLWQRIEAYVAWRWTERQVIWVVRGEGDWCPPLAPAQITIKEVWQDDSWVTVSLSASPYDGYVLPECGPYRFTATVGGGVVPAAVLEAFRRLAEYSAEIGKDGILTGHTANTAHSGKIGDGLEESFDRPATWAARALQNSGAADLLRPYRRV